MPAKSKAPPLLSAREIYPSIYAATTYQVPGLQGSWSLSQAARSVRQGKGCHSTAGHTQLHTHTSSPTMTDSLHVFV